MSDPHQEILLVELHRIIANAAQTAASKLGGSDGSRSAELGVSYPPEDGSGPILSSDESHAVSSLGLSAAARTGLAKLVADACAATVFEFLSLMDGVADPEVVDVDEWLGASLKAPEDDQEMLHDRFYESYWTYRERSLST
jgi:hypothetical protein